MENVDMKVIGDTLTITINLKENGRPSKTGKTMLVATTGAAQSVNYKGRQITLALNCMAKII